MNYEPLIITFAEPIRTLDNIFDDLEAWGIALLKERIDGDESSRFTQANEQTLACRCNLSAKHPDRFS